MIGAAGPTGTHLPEIRREYDHREQEENAGDLKPDDPTHTGKGPQKAAHAASNVPGGLAGDSGCFSSDLPGRAPWNDWPRGLPGRWGAGGRIDAGRHLLAGNFPGHAQAHAHHAAYPVGFHLVYDGISDARRAAFHSLFAIGHCPGTPPAVR